jgi:hypothetical protein
MITAVLYFHGERVFPMAQVLDRPLIQHVVEQLVERGVRAIRLLYRAEEEVAAQHLGDGTRWGIRVTSIPVKGQHTKEDFTAACSDVEPGLFLCGNAARLPHLPKDLAASAPWSSLFFEEEDGVGSWSGWALVESAVLPAFGEAVVCGLAWREACRTAGIQAKKVFLEHPGLSGTSPREILLANRRALNGQYPGLFFTGREQQPGVWIARGVKVAASARLQAPCYIGEDSWIGADCSVGPYSVIAPGSVVERGTSVTGSVVSEKTFLGPELEISDSMVVRNHVYNVRLDVDFVVGEDHIASGL